MSHQGGFRRLAFAVACGALCLTATGCSALLAVPRPSGTVPPSSASTPSTRSAAPAVTSSTTTAATAPSGERDTTAATSRRKPATPAAALPTGYRWRTVESVHTTFAAPVTWAPIDPGTLGDIGRDSAALKQLVNRTGWTAQRLVQVFDYVDLYLAGPAVSGYAPSLAAAVLPLQELPSEPAVGLGAGRVTSSQPHVRHTKTPVGEAIDVSYRIRVTEKTAYVHTVFIDTDEGVLDVTIGAQSEAVASSVTAVLLKTVHRS